MSVPKPPKSGEPRKHPSAQRGILEIMPYKGGQSTAAGIERIVKLSSNESPLGPSQSAIAAYQAKAKALHRYPDGASGELTAALARHFGLEPERIVCGNGSDEILALLAQAYAGPGDEVLYSQHGFLMYPIVAHANGAVPVRAPEREMTADVDQLLARVTDRTRLVFLTNPNNPTGTYLPEAEVRRFHRGLPGNVLLVLDAAYAEYVGRNDYNPGIELVRESTNVVMTRTFSKIYGLAGLRVGWAYMPAAVADVLQRIRGAFNVNAAAQAAAVAALADVAFIDGARTHNDIWRPKLAQGLEALGLEVQPSVANFLLVRFPAAPKHAAAAEAYLAARGILVRGMTAYGLDDCLRITVGSEEENLLLLAATREFLVS